MAEAAHRLNPAPTLEREIGAALALGTLGPSEASGAAATVLDRAIFEVLSPLAHNVLIDRRLGVSVRAVQK